jgi:ATP-binding cassette subfamily C (CFTR/MRP) protein 4
LLSYRTEIKSVAAACLCRIIDMSFKMFVNRVTLFSCILVITVTGSIVTPQYIFVVGTLFEMIRVPIAGHLSRGVTNVIELKFSLHRIEEFLLFGSKRQDKITLPKISLLEEKNNSQGVIARIEAENLTVQWNSVCSGYALYDLNFSIASGDLVAFVGAPGSGKSTLFQILLGEIDPVEGNLKVEGSVAYAAQEPWIFSATLKQNILFGEEMNDEKYMKVLKACALDQDLSLFPFGDRTIVGERGVMLSGGQKSRVNLARAIYRDADIYLLDDPLAALDVNVAKHVFDECITKYLKHKTVVLITHQVQYLRTVKRIYYLDKGEIVVHGTYEELESKGHFLKLQSTETNGAAIANVTEPVSVKQLEFPEEVKEHRSSGRIIHGYGNYCAAGGKWICLAAVSMFLMVQLLGCGLDYILIFCVNSQNKRLNEKSVNYRNQTHSKLVSDARWTDLLTTYVLYVYGTLIFLTLITIFLRSWIFVKFCTKAAVRLHDKMLSRIIFATMHFFNTNSSGRILNRFSKDVRSVDENLPTSLSETLQVFLNLVGSILLISVLNYWFIIPTIAFAILTILLSILFLPINVSNKRTEGISKLELSLHL